MTAIQICESYSICGRRAVATVDGLPMCQRCLDFDTAQAANDAEVLAILVGAGLADAGSV